MEKSHFWTDNVINYWLDLIFLPWRWCNIIDVAANECWYLSSMLNVPTGRCLLTSSPYQRTWHNWKLKSDFWSNTRLQFYLNMIKACCHKVTFRHIPYWFVNQLQPVTVQAADLRQWLHSHTSGQSSTISAAIKDMHAIMRPADQLMPNFNAEEFLSGSTMRKLSCGLNTHHQLTGLVSLQQLDSGVSPVK